MSILYEELQENTKVNSLKFYHVLLFKIRIEVQSSFLMICLI